MIGSEWALTAGHCGVGPSSSFTVGIHAQDEVTDDDKRFVTQVYTSSKLILKKTTLDDFHFSVTLFSLMFLPTAREGNVFTRVCDSVHNRSHGYLVIAHPCWLLGHSFLQRGQYASYWNAFLFFLVFCFGKMVDILAFQIFGSRGII